MLTILFLAAFLAATISGAAGFGGALLLLPVLSYFLGIKAAVPVLTIGQLFGNASRVWFGRSELTWKPILLFLATAVPLAMLGSYWFGEVDAEKIKVAIGIFLILLVAYRRMNIKKITLGDGGMLLGGGLTGFLSGIVGSAGPLGAAFFLGLDLAPTAYVASEAFTALTMHLVKIAVYNQLSLVGGEELSYGLFIGAAMIAGSWTGKKIIEKLSKDRFVVFVEILLIFSGFQFIFSIV